MENTPVTDGAAIPTKNIVFEVTTLSKVLAAVLFIMLPFVGFWAGYNFETDPIPVPEKTPHVEVPKTNTLTVEEQIAINYAAATPTATEQVADSNATSTCLSGKWGYPELKPIYNDSKYEIEYTQVYETSPTSTPYDYGTYPYNSNCRVSLIERPSPYQGVLNVIVPDLLTLMVEQNLPDGLLGTPKPYLFSGDHLIFGGNGYEGAVGGFYSFDIKTQKFTALTDRALKQSSTIILSPESKKILANEGDDSILIIDTDTLSTTTIRLPDIHEGETVIAFCEMGCRTKMGWADENIIWYAIYKKGDNYQNDYLRLSSLELDTVGN